MRVVALGDVGVVDDMMHIGDEAMFQAASTRRGHAARRSSRSHSAPAETAARYGVDALPRIRFDGLDRAASEARLAAVLALADGRDALGAGDPAHGVVAAVADADGVVIAGGGNLASTWPFHVYERAALAGVAARLGRPVVVTGQTLGPDLLGRDRELVAQLLRSARIVGVREAPSQRLAADLGVDARLGVDDASFLGLPPSGFRAKRDGVLVSLSLSLGRAPRVETVPRIARLVDAAADLVGGPVRFHAHFGPLTGAVPRGDAVLHEEVRARLRAPSTVVPTGDVAVRHPSPALRPCSSPADTTRPSSPRPPACRCSVLSPTSTPRSSSEARSPTGVRTRRCRSRPPTPTASRACVHCGATETGSRPRPGSACPATARTRGRGGMPWPTPSPRDSRTDPGTGRASRRRPADPSLEAWNTHDSDRRA